MSLEDKYIEDIKNSTLKLITINSNNTTNAEDDNLEPCNDYFDISVCDGIDIHIDYNPSINFVESKITTIDNEGEQSE